MVETILKTVTYKTTWIWQNEMVPGDNNTQENCSQMVKNKDINLKIFVGIAE